MGFLLLACLLGGPSLTQLQNHNPPTSSPTAPRSPLNIYSTSRKTLPTTYNVLNTEKTAWPPTNIDPFPRPPPPSSPLSKPQTRTPPKPIHPWPQINFIGTTTTQRPQTLLPSVASVPLLNVARGNNHDYFFSSRESQPPNQTS